MSNTQPQRGKAFMSNALSSLLLQIVSIIAGFIVPHALIAAYGSGVNGLVTSLTQFVSYIQLVEAGISSVAVFQLYRPIVRGDNIEVSRIVSAARIFYYKSGGVFTALMLVLACLYPVFVSTEGISSPGIFVLVLALGATGFLDFFTLAKYRVILYATQRNWVVQFATIIYKIIYTAIVLVGTFAGLPVVELFVVAIVPILVRTLILVAYVKRVFPQINFSADAGGVRLDQRWDAFFLQVLGAVQTGAPTIIATFVLGNLSLVSVFSIYMLVANGLQNAVNSLSLGTQASFGDVIARGQMEVLRRSFREFQVLSYGASAAVCGVGMALVVPFVSLYTADIADVDYVFPLVGFLCILNVLLYHLKTPQGLLVVAAGHYRQTRVQTSIQTIILLVASSCFGFVWGMPGILVGMCLSNIYRDIDLMYYIPKNVTHTNPKETLKLMTVAFLACMLIATPFMLLSLECVNWTQWLTYLVMLIAWAFIVVLGSYWLFARDQLDGLVSRALRMLRKGKR